MTVAEAGRVAAVVAHSFNCPPAVAASIAARSRSRRFARHATILWQDERATEAVLLVEGEAHAIAIAPNGQEMRLHVFGVGDLFGECGVLADVLAPASVIAARDTETAHFGAADFVVILETHNGFTLALLRRVIARKAMTEKSFSNVDLLSAPGRICKEIGQRARAADDLTLRPLPVFSEMARQLNTTRETVSRVVNGLKRRGIIELHDDRLVVVALRMLEEMIL